MGRVRPTPLGAIAAATLSVFALLLCIGQASAAEYLKGGGFEGGTEGANGGVDHPDWVESDSVFESPICGPKCNGDGPHSGTHYAWFGGLESIPLGQEQMLEQEFTTPEIASAEITYFIWSSEFGKGGFLKIELDGSLLAEYDVSTHQAFGGGYHGVTTDLGPLNAGKHALVLEFRAVGASGLGVVTINVDDLSLHETPVPVPETPKTDSVPKVIAPVPIDTKITKVQLYKATQGKSGSAKNPRRPIISKGKTGKTGKAAKAKFTFTGSGGEGELRFECKLDDGAFRPCTSPTFYKKLKLGSHTFSVYAVDRAGNKDETPASYEFKAKAGKSGRAR